MNATRSPGGEIADLSPSVSVFGSPPVNGMEITWTLNPAGFWVGLTARLFIPVVTVIAAAHVNHVFPFGEIETVGKFLSVGGGVGVRRRAAKLGLRQPRYS